MRTAFDGKPVVLVRDNSEDSYIDVGHCSFTSAPMPSPEVGKRHQYLEVTIVVNQIIQFSSSMQFC